MYVFVFVKGGILIVEPAGLHLRYNAVLVTLILS